MINFHMSEEFRQFEEKFSDAIAYGEIFSDIKFSKCFLASEFKLEATSGF
jgi:hypothetical protein